MISAVITARTSIVRWAAAYIKIYAEYIRILVRKAVGAPLTKNRLRMISIELLAIFSMAFRL